jgi:hypothetical protein
VRRFIAALVFGLGTDPMTSRCCLALLLLELAAPVRAADTGTITGTLVAAKGVTAVTAINRAGETDRTYKGTLDAKTGKFTIDKLPLGAAYDLIIDAGAVRLEGVNLKVPPSDYEEEQPLTKEDRTTITKICKLLNKFENEIEVMTIAGNCQHAAVLLNKKRTTPFYESKPGEMIWRLELWHFDKPEEDWIKSQDYLGIIHYRERLQKSAFAKKALTLDPALGGIALSAKAKSVDVGKVALPDGKAGIKLRPVGNALRGVPDK